MATITGHDDRGLLLTLRRLELSDLAEPEKWNPNYQTLLDNDAWLETNKLAVAGGSVTGDLTFVNGVGVYGRSTAGTRRALAYVNGQNLVSMGDVGAELRLASSVNPRVNVAGTLQTLLHEGNHNAANAGVHAIPTGYYVARSSRADQLPAWVDLQGIPDTASRWPSWPEINNKPTAFMPSAHALASHSDTTGFTPSGGDAGSATTIARGDHRHDGAYYTKAQIDAMLSGLPVEGHNHDNRYYTKAQADALLNGKSNAGHVHDTRYVRFDVSSQGLSGTQQGNARTNIAAAAASHTHATGDITGLQALLDGKAASSHTHDDRYYTEAEVTSLLAGKLNTSGTAANSIQIGGKAVANVVLTDTNRTIASGVTLTVAGTLDTTGTLRIPVK